MRYVSTRGATPALTFTEAVITGLAPDGGLLVPAEIPLVADKLEAWQDLSFVELAKAVIALFVDDIPAAQLDTLIERAYEDFSHPDVVAIKSLIEPRVEILELFYGPTLAFKDVALQLLGQIFEYILEQQGKHLNILGATSGDTGSAAIAGVRSLPAVDIFIMYPQGKISPLQELQMTTVMDDNVHCLAVEGSFDDCQTLMKAVFNDPAFKSEYSLGAINSVNWARVLAQIVYYGYASVQLGRQAPVTFCVPTGNFGNVFAGSLAKRMGFPIEQLIVATNENDILAVFFATGRYELSDVRYTVTPAMDIQVASNFERYLYYHFDCDPERLKAFMQAFADDGVASLPGKPDDDFLATTVNQADTLETIRDTYRNSGYVVDPHTAIGIAAASRFTTTGPKVCIATAHPAKFPESVNKAIGAEVARHPTLDALAGLESRRLVVPASADAIKDVIRQYAR
jgi:threonine synthase